VVYLMLFIHKPRSPGPAGPVGLLRSGTGSTFPSTLDQAATRKQVGSTADRSGQKTHVRADIGRGMRARDHEMSVEMHIRERTCPHTLGPDTPHRRRSELPVTDNTDTPPTILHAVPQWSPDMVLLTTLSGTVQYIDPAGRALIGLRADEPVASLATTELFTAAGLQRAAEVAAGLKSRGQWRGVSELRQVVSGEAIAVTVIAFVVPHGDDSPVVVVSVLRDRRLLVTEHEVQRAKNDAAAQYGAEQKAIADLAQLALDSEEQELIDAAIVAASAMIGVERAEINRAPRITYGHGGTEEHRTGNDGRRAVMAAVTGTDPGPLSLSAPTGMTSLTVFTASVGQIVVCADREVEDRFDTKDMAAFGMSSGVGIPITDYSDRPWGVLTVYSTAARTYREQDLAFLRTIAGVLSSALRRHQLDRRLREQNLRDDLTGLPNRTLAYERIDAALARSRVSSVPVAVLLLDIDDFKIINDSLGHESGDRSSDQTRGGRVHSRVGRSVRLRGHRDRGRFRDGETPWCRPVAGVLHGSSGTGMQAVVVVARRYMLPRSLRMFDTTDTE
jgi:GAF domain-containing protein